MTVAEPLDKAFQALANPTRRAVVERLVQGSATVSELAAPFSMALPSFLQHLRMLEEAGLVESSKRGRTRTFRVKPKRLKRASDWLTQQRELWEKRLDQLDTYIESMEKSDE
ncbi:HTH-type transcriptional regulator [Pseudobythopirellula maris]|uniref:HTH-type transcriptional regulator n=1 Tax=Pseudobythopirellula maris TaxID=2527991 RepID=A0A5C5ZUW0_9BACT|nr:metalloregulator ArsR/SmtB family transcription factor [Pseudobythopirellula maris]TWT90767.1 HTH-type transcriptional regulator [Pseudobythopirellula maris]